MTQVQGKALFTPVDAKEIGTHVTNEWAITPGHVAVFNRLNFYDLRSHINHQHSRIWSGQDPSKT